MSFAERMNLRPADVIVTHKSEFKIIEHYVVYRGQNEYGQHIYMENKAGIGVRYITEDVFVQENPKYIRIRPFQGDSYDRHRAVARADSKVGSPYVLFGDNCENFANYVQFDNSYSKQTGNIFGGLALFALAVLLLGAAGSGSNRS